MLVVVLVVVEDELESSGRVTVSILSLLSEGRLGFSLQSFRHIHRTEIHRPEKREIEI